MADEPWIPPLRYCAHSMVRWFAPTEILRGADGEFLAAPVTSVTDADGTSLVLPRA